MSETRPVLIVGAGPIGLTAAMELSRFGVPVRIVDKLPVPAATSRAIAVHARTLELLAPRGPGREMVQTGNRGVAVTIHGDGKRLGRIDLSRIKSRYNYVLLLLAGGNRAAAGRTASRGRAWPLSAARR